MANSRSSSISGSISSLSTPAVRRSVTLPLRPSDSNKSSPTQDSQVETLYAHPSARVVQFTAGSSIYSKPFPGDDAATAEEEAGSLSWTSNLERTIAVGSLRLYRAPGSVAFLNCGRVVQAILPKSKCWCVEESTGKFILQMRKPQYWRIELGDIESIDSHQVEELKTVFSEVLLFEKTACPFKRDFTVELPEAPITPIKYKPWRPVPRPAEATTASTTPSPLNNDSSARSRETFRDTDRGNDYFTATSDDDSIYAYSNTTETPQNDTSRPIYSTDNAEESNSRPEILQASRSVTAPPQLTVITSPPSKPVEIRSSSKGSSKESSSDASSLSESFHSVQSWHSPLTPSHPSPTRSGSTSPVMFPYPHNNICLPKRAQHTHEISEATITPETPGVETPGVWGSTNTISEEHEGSSTPPPRTPTLIDDIEDNLDEEHFEISTPPPKQRLRHRATTGNNSRRRPLSPLPPAANIFSPSRRRPRHLQTARHLPTAILQKTCEILMSPPSHLLHIMLDIASKIAAGEWRGMVYGFGEGGEEVVGRWDYDDADLVGDNWDEDDYGIKLAKGEPRKRRTKRSDDGSWEID